MTSPFRIFANDTVDIQKVDGTRFEGLKAHVDKSTITFFSTDTPIDADDLIVRHLPHGRSETFRVVDPGYSAGFTHAIPPSYQARVVRA